MGGHKHTVVALTLFGRRVITDTVKTHLMVLAHIAKALNPLIGVHIGRAQRGGGEKRGRRKGEERRGRGEKEERRGEEAT